MTILGVGVDVVRSGRLRQTYEKHGERFLRRYLHPTEIQQFQKLTDHDAQTQFLASRWAVKEATYKAFKSWRILFPDILLSKEVSDVLLPPHIDVATLPPQVAPRVPVLVFDGQARVLADALRVSVCC
ncbi:Aste57867_10114 [Aphanomyces stellatus]|uniref:Aste57867_10114 protein n=1 Tax=Aphanomyces stellatus TaxID=120398 RepID=A0A485KPJ5_9STRA|nr:hypothetical protein As57867_010075 [Aphanomyces stellatus]VFT86990.1 Aste57867_10114 [Aphanomyces stellatus]